MQRYAQNSIPSLEAIHAEMARRGLQVEGRATWQPQLGPQTLAFDSEADELFYGGAAGGGKTDLLLGVAGMSHRNSIIFRRVFPELRGVIERSREIFNAKGDTHSRDSYNEQLHLWRLAGNRVVEFGAIQYEKDRENYRGRPHDFYGWDEVTEFTESQFRFVNAWNRSTVPGQRCRVIATGNPPTSAAGEWVIRYWSPWLDSKHPNPARPGELRWFARVENKDVEVESGESFKHENEIIRLRSRTFIPAKLSDNPILEATGYGAVIQNLPEPLRSQLLYGDFSIGLQDEPYQVIPTEWVRAAIGRWTPEPPCPQTTLGIDVARGGDDKSVLAPRHGAWFGPLVKRPGKSTPDGNAVVKEVVKAREGDSVLLVDVIGVGSSVYDILKSMELSPVGINFGEGTEATDRSGRLRFRNVRAAAYWRFRELLDPANGSEIALPDDSELLADLTAPRWSLAAGKITIEAKDDIIKRIGRSPDCGDAVVLACCNELTRKRSVQMVEVEF